jgi:hypothetical protein
MIIKDVFSVQLIDTTTGEVIGEMETAPQTVEIEKQTHAFQGIDLTGRFTTITLEDAKINYNVLSEMVNPNPTFKMIMSSLIVNRLKYLHSRTKNRRIKKKLHKRINKLDHPLFNNEILVRKDQLRFQ